MQTKTNKITIKRDKINQIRQIVPTFGAATAKARSSCSFFAQSGAADQLTGGCGKMYTGAEARRGSAGKVWAASEVRLE